MKKIFLSLIALMATMSINAEVIKVYENGSLSATYTDSPTNVVKVIFEGVSAPASHEPASHEYVNLGLSVMWATCNVGAEHCYDYGNYFAWGETTGYDEGKTTFDWSTYTLCQGTKNTMTKYCTNSYYGSVDNKTVLESTDDAATANWGSDWRMPTYAELSELNNYCSWTWYAAGNTEFNGVAGYKVQSLKTGYTDKYIFLPAAGNRYSSLLANVGSNGSYWTSSSLYGSYSYDACGLFFLSEDHSMGFTYRYYGQSVRPVRALDTQIVKVYVNGELTATYTNTPTNTVEVVFGDAPAAPEHEYVVIGGVKWATMNVGATTVAGSPSTCFGDYFAWGETEPRYTGITIWNEDYATFNGWSSSHSKGYSGYDDPTYTGETLDTDHDAATKNWGSDWRTPTEEDFKALTYACTGSLSFQAISSLSSSSPTGGIYWLPSDQTYLPEYTGVAGIIFVDKTDTSKRVFFPAAGDCFETDFYGGSGHYWSSTNRMDGDNAIFMYFNSSGARPWHYYNRVEGCSIRPVRVQN